VPHRPKCKTRDLAAIARPHNHQPRQPAGRHQGVGRGRAYDDGPDVDRGKVMPNRVDPTIESHLRRCPQVELRNGFVERVGVHRTEGPNLRPTAARHSHANRSAFNELEVPSTPTDT
jgi:hypothetical protein